MSIPLNPGRKPVSMNDVPPVELQEKLIDAISEEFALRKLANIRGKTVEEMKQILEKSSQSALLELKWYDMEGSSEFLKNLCFVLMVTYQVFSVLLIWRVA